MTCVEGVVRGLFRVRTLPNKHLLCRFMGSAQLLLADVGATGNQKGVWREASEFSSFVLICSRPGRFCPAKSSMKNM